MIPVIAVHGDLGTSLCSSLTLVEEKLLLSLLQLCLHGLSPQSSAAHASGSMLIHGEVFFHFLARGRTGPQETFQAFTSLTKTEGGGTSFTL